MTHNSKQGMETSNGEKIHMEGEVRDLREDTEHEGSKVFRRGGINHHEFEVSDILKSMGSQILAIRPYKIIIRSLRSLIHPSLKNHHLIALSLCEKRVIVTRKMITPSSKLHLQRNYSTLSYSIVMGAAEWFICRGLYGHTRPQLSPIGVRSHKCV